MMTTFTTEDREEAEKNLKPTPEELGKVLEKLVDNYIFLTDEPIPFFGWIKPE